MNKPKGYYSIENKAKRAYGETNAPELGMYILKDGTYLNGSYEGDQRDRDHREVSEFFNSPKAKTKNLGSSTYALIKFVKRGNIRMHYSPMDNSIALEFDKNPTREQWKTIKSLFLDVRSGIYNYILLEKMNTKIEFTDLYKFAEWLDKRVDYYLY